MALLIAFSCALLLLFWAVGAIKRLKLLRGRVLRAFPEIDLQLKRRYDLIRELARKIDTHFEKEHEALNAVIAARNRGAALQLHIDSVPAGAELMKQMIAAKEELDAALERLYATCDASQELNADLQWRQLREEMRDALKRIELARQNYGDCAAAYNAAIEQFPHGLIARAAGFRPVPLPE